MIPVEVVGFDTRRCSCLAGPDTALALATSPNIRTLCLDDSRLGWGGGGGGGGGGGDYDDAEAI
jgi:hypothetical protein